MEKNTRFDTFDKKIKGISESVPVDFYSPYGCSKGGADQYIHDFSRIYNIPTVVLRQSCIYGERQFGVEDQGWLAWFMASLLLRRKVTVYGSGKQVRDVLYISDLVKAYRLTLEKINDTGGQIFNIGGGKNNAVSINEFLTCISKKYLLTLRSEFKKKRDGDQLYYISDNTKFEKITGWQPEIGFDNGIDLLNKWLVFALPLIRKIIS